MIESIQTPEVVNGKVQDVVVRDSGNLHMPTREPEAELLIDSPADWLSRRLPWRGDAVYGKTAGYYKRKCYNS